MTVVLLGNERGLYVVQDPGEQITRVWHEGGGSAQVNGELLIAAD